MEEIIQFLSFNIGSSIRFGMLNNHIMSEKGGSIKRLFFSGNLKNI